MAISHTARSAAEEERCSCAETTTAVGEMTSEFYCVVKVLVKKATMSL